jgi:WhiB family transcriptional regulator, redox-sensing transcriptional regulator
VSRPIRLANNPVPDDENWQTQAVCRPLGPDDDTWFPRTRPFSSTGKRVCNGPSPDKHPELGCPVKAQCLAHALDNDIRWGTWGGLDMWERAQLQGRSSPYRAYT